jgi:cytochrome c oxidase subunit II
MWSWLIPLAHAGSSTFAPVQGSKIAGDWDAIYMFLVVSSLISFIILIGGMCYFVWKFRRRSGTDKTAYITHNHTLEFLWSFIPFLIFMFVFAWGWLVYHDMRKFPDNALEVHVYGKKWDWRFVYKSGKEAGSTLDANNQKVPATLVVPINRPVKLIMASEKVVAGSQDPLDRPVLHSFFVPAFRVKQDLVPGRYSALWFEPNKLGTFNVFCAEYCGAGHSQMRGFVKVVSQEDFETWLASEGAAAGGSLADQGKALYQEKACFSCHSMDGTRIVGPSFKGLFGRTEPLTGGGTVKVDEDYIRESILTPQAKIVDTYPPSMPPFAGVLSEEQINAIIEFIKTVK